MSYFFYKARVLTYKKTLKLIRRLTQSIMTRSVRILMYPNYMHSSWHAPALISVVGTQNLNPRLIEDTLMELVSQETSFPPVERDATPEPLGELTPLSPIYLDEKVLPMHEPLFRSLFPLKDSPKIGDDSFFLKSPVSSIDDISWAIFRARVSMRVGCPKMMFAEAGNVLDLRQLQDLFMMRELSDKLFFGHLVTPLTAEEDFLSLKTPSFYISQEVLEGDVDPLCRAAALANACKRLARRMWTPHTADEEFIKTVKAVHQGARARALTASELESQRRRSQTQAPVFQE